MKIAIILAKSSSKRIPNKNFMKFHGKPMIYWTIQAAKKSKEEIGEREIENPKYKGKVHLYRKEFLDKYFNVNQTDDLPF